MNKFRVGIIGATGYIGQRFVTLLADHPWFTVEKLFASAKSTGKTYGDAVKNRWKLDGVVIPVEVKDIQVLNTADIDLYKNELDFVFCAVDMPKEELIALEEHIAKLEIPVISNNSANRGKKDVPMIIPEINPEHSKLIKAQQKRLGTVKGFIACKPNCSIQSYVPALTALQKFQPEKILVSTYQAISGAGKTFKDWPEMANNLIPFIGGEEEKSEQEPLKIWGELNSEQSALVLKKEPIISAQCYRVAVQEGHTASVAVSFKIKPTYDEMVNAWNEYKGKITDLNLPSAPEKFLTYFIEENRPQVRQDVNLYNGMGIAIGRLRTDKIFDYKFTCLSHNTIRGAAGGAILMAELLVKQGFITKK